jgi:hypothetical protein
MKPHSECGACTESSGLSSVLCACRPVQCSATGLKQADYDNGVVDQGLGMLLRLAGEFAAILGPGVTDNWE